MSAVASKLPHSRNHSTHAPALKKRAQNVSNVEKWDVAVWNDQVHSSQLPDHRPTLLSLRSASLDNVPRSFASVGSDNAPTGPSRPPATLPGPATPSFAFSASAFCFGSSSVKPRPIPRRVPSHSPVAESPQIRIDALDSLHRSVQEQDERFLARMRELEERCHLIPDLLSVLRSDDLVTRGRKRGCTWDEDGDVEMSCWNERRRRHFDARSCSRLSLDSAENQKEYGTTGSEDEYVMADEDRDSDSEEEDDDLDIVIVQGSSVPSLLNSGSTSPLSVSLSSLPARSDAPSPNMGNFTALPTVFGSKDVDELSMAMAGGAGSVVSWCTPTTTDGAHDVNSTTAQAGALWA